MPRFNRREQLPLHIKRAICAHHVDNPRLRHVDLARWCYTQYGLHPDRSTVDRIVKLAERWAVTATGDNQLTQVHDDEPSPTVYPDIELDDDIDDVGTLISGLALGNAAMTAAEYVAIDDDEPTCAEGTAGQPATEPEAGLEVELWHAPTTMQAVYDDADPVCREARRTARAACEMLIGYARATRITPRDLCHLFDIRNPIVIARMERASPSFNLNVAPQPVPSPGATPTPETPRPRGRVLPGWMTRPSRCQELFDAGVGAVMDGYVDAAEWMRLLLDTAAAQPKYDRLKSDSQSSDGKNSPAKSMADPDDLSKSNANVIKKRFGEDAPEALKAASAAAEPKTRPRAGFDPNQKPQEQTPAKPTESRKAGGGFFEKKK
ncbi:unnamed protein product [Closterium sp. NIES-64]|nr:unnamed protein product [Closterium sp. NIES-64]